VRVNVPDTKAAGSEDSDGNITINVVGTLEGINGAEKHILKLAEPPAVAEESQEDIQASAEDTDAFSFQGTFQDDAAW